MKITIVGRKYEASDALKEKIAKKLSKLDKFFEEETEAVVTMSQERGRDRMEVTIVHKGTMFRAEVLENDMVASLDRIVDIIERQIRKNKTRLEKRLRQGAFDLPVAMPQDTTEDAEEQYVITKYKKFVVRPMLPEEAIMQMNLLGHEFFLFRNGETDEINLVYKKNNGEYGLIIPIE